MTRACPQTRHGTAPRRRPAVRCRVVAAAEAVRWTTEGPAMRRIAVLLGIVAVVLFGLLVLGRAAPRSAAQDDATATAAHPAVGAWLLIDPAFSVAPETLAVVHADGTYVQAEAGGGPVGVGAWEAT